MGKLSAEEFFKRFHKKIYILCYSSIRNRADAQDLTSEIVLEILEKYLELDNPEHYLFSILNKRIKTFHSSRKKALVMEEEFDEQVDGGHLFDELTVLQTELNVSESSRKQFTKILEEVLLEVDNKSRQVFMQHHFMSKELQKRDTILKEFNISKHVYNQTLDWIYNRIREKIDINEKRQ
jgi:DNA-directed RNA polymerase specialized sigma24 family protein